MSHLHTPPPPQHFILIRNINSGVYCYFQVYVWCFSFESCLLMFYFPSVMSSASETCNDFHPMFFTHDKSFEEFFCTCIQLLNKTWKEMRATSEDFNKARERGNKLAELAEIRFQNPETRSLCTFPLRLQGIAHTHLT